MIIKHVVPTVAAIVFAGSAFAAALSMTGTIKSIEAAKNDIVLQGGETFTLPAKFDIKTLKVGEKVKITYENKGGAMTASKVEAMK